MIIKVVSLMLRSGQMETLKVPAWDERDFQRRIHRIMRERNASGFALQSTERPSYPPSKRTLGA